MKYEVLRSISREELEDALSAGSAAVARRALLRMALHEPDRKWAAQKCLAALRDQRVDVRAAAITSLGHLARIHRCSDLEQVMPALQALKADPELGGIAEDALEDILIFTTPRNCAS
jgi:hypothetical protein